MPHSPQGLFLSENLLAVSQPIDGEVSFAMFDFEDRVWLAVTLDSMEIVAGFDYTMHFSLQKLKLLAAV